MKSCITLGTFLILSLSAFAGLGRDAPSDETTNTGLSPQGPSPTSQEAYPKSGLTRNRSGLTKPDMSVTETSDAGQDGTQAEEQREEDGPVFPIGPYVNGEYRRPFTAEDIDAQDRLLETNEEGETRVNRMGPNKR